MNEQTGMTLKQMAIKRYLDAIQKHKDSVKNNDSHGIVAASLEIMGYTFILDNRA